MSLIVLTPSAPQPAALRLCTLQNVKDELAGDPGVAGTTFDGLLTALVDEASETISSYTDQVFSQQVYRETLPGMGSTTLMLNRTPVASVASVLYQAFPITDYTIDDKDAGILYRQNLWDYTTQVGWVLGGAVMPGALATDSVGGFTVDYTAGWITPSQTSPPISSGPTLPLDLTKACIELVKFWYLRRRIDPDVAERRIDAVLLRYREGMDSQPPRIPRTVEWLLKPYVRTTVNIL